MNNIVKLKIRSYFTLLESMMKFEGVVASRHEKENARDHDGMYAP